MTGGNYDVDLELKSPSGKVLYQATKKQYDQIEKDVEEDGVYEFCFSNEFSTFTHKVIYIGAIFFMREMNFQITGKVLTLSFV